MALREFVDESGREWMVWDVYPTLLERRRADGGPPQGVAERRRHKRARASALIRLAQGWLAFEARDGERRRLVPIPHVGAPWSDASQIQLCSWCALAEPARARGHDE